MIILHLVLFSKPILELEPVGGFVHDRHLAYGCTQLVLDVRFRLESLSEVLHQFARVGDLALADQLDDFSLHGVGRHAWCTGAACA